MASGLNRRLELQQLLEDVSGLDTNHVHFDPPDGLILDYPCIVYNWSNDQAAFADNKPYARTRRYVVTVMDLDPDSEIPDAIAELPMCTHDRNFPSDNVHNSVFTLFF